MAKVILVYTNNKEFDFINDFCKRNCLIRSELMKKLTLRYIQRYNEMNKNTCLQNER